MSTPKILLISLGVIAFVAFGIILLNRGHDSPKSSDAENVQSLEQTADPNVIRYLPLGGSYTIGESVNVSDRLPNQLVARLQKDTVSM
ncbi:hypothetical protein H7097_04405 [Aeromicrobium sp.]|nr:hypothetical protein [Candidatus Saccharibacteria bacterium]